MRQNSVKEEAQQLKPLINNELMYRPYDIHSSPHMKPIAAALPRDVGGLVGGDAVEGGGAGGTCGLLTVD